MAIQTPNTSLLNGPKVNDRGQSIGIAFKKSQRVYILWGKRDFCSRFKMSKLYNCQSRGNHGLTDLYWQYFTEHTVGNMVYRSFTIYKITRVYYKITRAYYKITRAYHRITKAYHRITRANHITKSPEHITELLGQITLQITRAYYRITRAYHITKSPKHIKASRGHITLQNRKSISQNHEGMSWNHQNISQHHQGILQNHQGSYHGIFILSRHYCINSIYKYNFINPIQVI